MLRRPVFTLLSLLLAASSGRAQSEERHLAMAALGAASMEKPGEKKTEQTPLGEWSPAQQQAPPKEGSLYEEALRAAPILWFSDDEPLLRLLPSGTRHWLPSPLPCDPKPAGRPVVYYKLDAVRVNRALQAAEREAIYEGRLPLDAVEHMRINYYFYYPEDMGLNPHIHDIESISVELDVVREKKRGGEPRAAKVERNRVTGWAHGSELMANILQIKPSLRSASGAPDTRTPITILVEEGKHASCPDRNGDGIYTPGIDVNVRVADAWGIRDVFGGGVVGSKYQSFMQKNRLVPVRAGTEQLSTDVAGLLDLTDTLIARLERLERERTDPAVPSPEASPAPVVDAHDPRRYRIGPDLDPSHDVFKAYEDERRANGGLSFPSLRYELRDVMTIPEPYCADVEAPFPRGTRRPPPAATATARRLDWKGQGHIFQAACPEPDGGSDADDRADEGADVLLLKEDSCGYLNLPASVAALRGKPPITRTKLTYKYGSFWPIQPFRNAFLGARYDRGGAGFTVGIFSGYGLPKFGGWFNAGATVVKRDDEWAWSTSMWFTPSIATLATWYTGLGYDYKAEGLAATSGHWAVEGGVQIRHGALGLRLGARSKVSRGRLSSTGIVTELVYGPATRGTRVH